MPTLPSGARRPPSDRFNPPEELPCLSTNHPSYAITPTRINAIALAHRVLQEVDAQTVVNLRTLLNELAALLHDAFAEGVEAQPAVVRAPPVNVETDIAVPLSLWLVEQLAEIYRTAIERRTPLTLQIEADEAVDAIDLKIRFDGTLARAADS